MAEHHRAGLKFLLALAATFAALLAAEGAVRLLGLAPVRAVRPRYTENPAKTAALDLYSAPPRGGFDVDLRDPSARAAWTALGLPGLDALAGVTPYGIGFAYNALRCRDRDPGPRQPGVARVVVLGDSFTEGEGVRADDTFSRRVEVLLRREGHAVEVINCGRRGRDFPVLHQAFDGLLAYAPDVVLYAMVLNDPEQTPAFRARQSYLNDWILDRRSMADGPEGRTAWRSGLFDLVGDRLESAQVARATTRWYLDMTASPNAAGWAATQAHLAAMDRAMTARGGRLVVALLPLLVDLEGDYPFAPVHREVARACERAGIAFHDVLPALRGTRSADLWVHPVDLHPNARAHARIAADLAPVVAAALPR